MDGLTRGDFSACRAVVFDFDGTLADTKPSIIATATTVLTAWGLTPDELTRVGDLIGPPFPQAYEQVFGLSHEDAVEVTRRYREIYHKLGADAWPLFAGMRDLLDDLHDAGRLLAVASSKRANLVGRGLSDNGILDLFDSVRARQSDEDTTKAEAILAALDDLGVGLDEAVMVGDRHHDIDAATACGIPCIGVLYGDTARPGELEEAGAAAIAHTVEDLRVLLGA